ncbi:Fic family protein [Aneurinibacillus terranovensis]|uniref:Fic family protein n=1 Tax=Aneurinibacillus terranovensis TaxID=278991 RepID=UPI000410EA59|nr:Fic family protein [Aneurinibacillus terranovensis]
MYIFKGKHFEERAGKLVFIPNVNYQDYEIMQAIFEAERNIGALARLGLKDHPLKPTILRNSMVRTAHFTTKIEQNKLGYKEVQYLYEGYKAKKLSLKEKSQIEVANVFEAYNYLYKLQPENDFYDMDERTLIKLHTLLMQNLTNHPEGYRKIPVSLTDGNGNVSYVPPSSADIDAYMNAFFEWLYTSVTGYENPYSIEEDHSKKVHPLILSGITHHFIGYIHPFPDGNGRTARAFSTLVGLIHPDLSKIKDAFAVEEFIDRYVDEYYDTLMAGTQGDLNPFLLFYLNCVNQSLLKVLKELQRYDRVKHLTEILGKSHAGTMLQIIARMEDGEVFQRSLFDNTLQASTPSITNGLRRLKELGVIRSGDSRGNYIVCIVDDI